ncbi:glutaredoxin family protein [Clostridium sp.]|uniref:glutaredoxin family protein n=1 Tax=Clostridium sp. TaxID=1506 RepID=UPI002614EBC3|nr:glutaredoxin family protein [Clostridium sp.]
MSKNKIKVYSTNSCPWCVKAKNYLKTNNFEYEEFNVGVDQEAAREMIEKSGQRGVPVIDIDGSVIVGFDKNMIDRILGI